MDNSTGITVIIGWHTSSLDSMC